MKMSNISTKEDNNNQRAGERFKDLNELIGANT